MQENVRIDPKKSGKRRKRCCRLLRFLRGYLMTVGALTTLYALVQLLVLLFVEIAKWNSALPLS